MVGSTQPPLLGISVIMVAVFTVIRKLSFTLFKLNITNWPHSKYELLIQVTSMAHGALPKNMEQYNLTHFNRLFNIWNNFFSILILHCC